MTLEWDGFKGMRVAHYGFSLLYSLIRSLAVVTRFALTASVSYWDRAQSSLMAQ